LFTKRNEAQALSSLAIAKREFGEMQVITQGNVISTATVNKRTPLASS
jgi:hypothetical protein